jgi:hypothetical protein
MRPSEHECRDPEPRTLFEVMMGVTAEEWDSLSLTDDGEDDEQQPAPF